MGSWLFVLALFLVPLSTTAEKGFILLLPDVMVPETTLQLKLNLIDVDSDGEVLVSLAQVQYPHLPNNTKLIASKKIQVQNERDVPISLDIPALNEASSYYYNYFIQINGSFPDWEFSKEARVQMKESNFKVFVQADKPLYKPGHLVQFRLLVVNTALRPLTDAMGDVWIEDPFGTRMANWLNQTFKQGINQYSFQLIDEPPLGNWAIIAKINGQTSRTSFEVKEYVLPKFEVLITPPSYVLQSHRQITWKICGQYTYDKPVGGVLRINASYVEYYYNRGMLHVPSIVTVEEVSDCYNYTLNLEDLDSQKGNQTYHYDTNKVQIKVELEEKGTGNTEKAVNTVSRSMVVDVFVAFVKQDGVQNEFKPGFPIYRTLKVTRPDDSPAADVSVELCYTTKNDRRHLCWKAESLYSACRRYTSDSAGLIKFGVPPQGQDVTSISITANYTQPGGPLSGLYDASSSLTLTSWYSPSQSFIQIQPVYRELSCGEKESVSVLFTGDSSDITVYYQILSKGKLLIQDKMQTCPTCHFSVDPDDNFIYSPSSNEEEETDDKMQFFKKLDEAFPVPKLSRRLNYANVSFTPTFDLAPSASLLVFFVRADGEIVADATTLTVSKCLKNQAELEFSTPRDYPGSPLSYKLVTAPNSWCGITAVDKSLYLMSTKNKLEVSSIYDYLNSLTYKSYIQQKTIRACPAQPRCYARYYQTGRAKRSAIRPGPYISPPPYQPQSYLDSIEAFERSGTKILTNLKVEVRPCDQSSYPGTVYQYESDYAAYPQRAPVAAAFGDRRMSIGAAPGNAGPPALRTGSGSSSAKSVVPLRYNFPETWLWDLVYVEDGKVTQTSELPHTLTTWEGNAVCIHPDQGIAISPSSNVTGFQPFFVSFNMPYSVVRGEKVPLVVSVANYLDTCLPIKLSLDEGDYELEGSPTSTLCLCGNRVETHTFYLTPKAIGSLNMTVRGLTAPDPAVCEGQDYSSQPARDAESKILLVEPEGIPLETTLSSMVCPKDNEESSTPFSISIPEDSNLVPDSVRVYLSASGDLLGSALRNLDRLVSKPTGCGEQTLVRYLPNILVLQYLAVTNQKDPELEARALANIRAGYQRIMSFKRNDGSFAPWGKTDHDGSIQLTSQVVMTNREASQYIDVDQEDLRRSRDWIISKQHPIDGCFTPLGFVHSSYLRDTHKRSTITALVLSSLLESGYQNETVVSDAVSCIKLDMNPPVYTLAISAYAYSLAKREEEARQHLTLLEEKSFSEGGYKYWLPSAESSSGGPRDLTMDESSIEVAGYVAMAMIQLDGRDGISDVLPVIKGLVSKMNINGGFYSSQDTLVALRALSKYSSLLTSEDLARDLTYTFTPGSQSFHVDDTNRLVQQLERMVDTNTDLEVAAKGQGCGLVQVQARYNVFNPPEPNAFQLSAQAEQNPEKCHHVMKVCYGYLLDGLSNMVIMEVKMVSGYEPLPITLDLLKDENRIRKYEVKDQVVNFYFEAMSQGERCIEFIITRTLPVEEVKPSSIKISDYYKQELSAIAEYQVENTACP